MANVKLSYATVVSLTITNANLAASKTAGWQSASQDNSSNLYLDALVQIDLAAVNTAPAGTQAVYLYAYATVDSSTTNYTTVGDGVPSGSEGTITFPDVTANAIPIPLIGIVPYPVQNKHVISAQFSIARAHGGVLPPKYGLCMINDTGMTLSVNSIKITPVYMTVV